MRTVKLDKKAQKELLKRAKQIENEKREPNISDNSINYLMDSNILYKILEGGISILENLKNHSNGKKIKFMLLDRLYIEFHNVIKKKLSEGNTGLHAKDRKKVEKKLNEIGEIIELKSPEGSKERIWAREFWEQEKYINERNGKPLGEVDCLLLKFYLDNSDYELVTNDGLLKKTASDGGEKNGRRKMIFDPVE